MIYAFLFLVLLSMSATAWLAVTVFQLRREHSQALRQAETTWTEALRSLETTVEKKAASEDLRHLALMLEGVASASLRIERRVSALERPSSSVAANEPTSTP